MSTVCDVTEQMRKKKKISSPWPYRQGHGDIVWSWVKAGHELKKKKATKQNTVGKGFDFCSFPAHKRKWGVTFSGWLLQSTPRLIYSAHKFVLDGDSWGGDLKQSWPLHPKCHYRIIWQTQSIGERPSGNQTQCLILVLTRWWANSERQLRWMIFSLFIWVKSTVLINVRAAQSQACM